MTNFPPHLSFTSSTYAALLRLFILNEFLQPKRDSSCCALPRRLHDGYLISTAPQQFASASSFFFVLFVGLSTVLPFSFPIRFTFSISSSSSFSLSLSSSSLSLSSYCIYISCNFLRLDSEQFGNTHIHQLSRSHLRARFGNCSTSNFEASQ